MDIYSVVKLSCKAVGISEDQAVDAALFALQMVSASNSAPVPDCVEVAAMRKRIEETFDFAQPPVQRMTAAEVCKAIGVTSPSRGQTMYCSRAISSLTGKQPVKSNGQKLHNLPRKRQ